MSHQSRIKELAAQILADTTKVEECLIANGQPLPSFEPDGPANLVLDDKDAEKARLVSIDAATELVDLLRGPKACLRPNVNATSLLAIYRWAIPQQVPLDGDISFGDLAQRVKMRESDLRRIIRYAIAWHRVFCEPRAGYVAHSAASKLLVDESLLFDSLGAMYEDTWKAHTRVCDAIQMSDADEPDKTGFQLAYNTDKTLWKFMETDPARSKRFANTMQAYTSSSGHSLSLLVTGYPWHLLPEGCTIIDVGGSKGFVSLAIAEAHPHLKFIVQDLPEVIEQMHGVSSEAVSERVTYMAHDFLTPQTQQGDVYLFRWVLHDWSDAYVLKILRNMIPALKPGAKIVINDQLIPAPGSVPLVVERETRYGPSYLTIQAETQGKLTTAEHLT
ncbi:MAG: hypothetical protein Q9160_006980 [Pyrenula sp. 1 TL-2023]